MLLGGQKLNVSSPNSTPIRTAFFRGCAAHLPSCVSGSDQWCGEQSRTSRTSARLSNETPRTREQSPSERHAHLPIAGEARHWDIGKLVDEFRIPCTSDKSCGGGP